MKPKVILCLALVLSGVISIFALSVEIQVTTNSLNQGQCVFSISNNVVKGGIAFHIRITAQYSDTISNSGVGLCVITNWGNPDSTRIIKTPITFKKNGRIATADFVAWPELLNTPDLYFDFSTVDFGITPEGRHIWLPDGRNYDIKLRDFLKP
jgi:hypothetical protein